MQGVSVPPSAPQLMTSAHLSKVMKGTREALDFPPQRDTVALPLIKRRQLLWKKRTTALQTPVWIDLGHTGTGSGPLAS